MRIAQVAPLHESVPPKLYGGTERVVSYLTEALVDAGHQVTLFASGDSVTKAELAAPCEQALRLHPDCKDPIAYHFMLLEEVFRRASEFDILHFHTDYLHFPLTSRHAVHHLTTLHGRLDLAYLPALFKYFPDVPLVSISNSQRKPLRQAFWRATVYHGLPIDLHKATTATGHYLAFLGRISPEKRLDYAIEIATRAGLPLKIAAKIDASDREYFTTRIEPLLRSPRIEYIGEISEWEKTEFLGGARALLFPIDWPEPFGLAMIEAMACGTPVIAFRRGSVPEVVDQGVTGFIVDNVDEAVRAVEQIDSISRAGCRARFERRFTDVRMMRDYVQAYEQLLSELSPQAILAS